MSLGEVDTSERLTEEIVRHKEIDQFIKCFKKIDDKLQCLIESCATTFTTKTAAIKHLKNLHANISVVISDQRTNVQKKKQSDDIQITVKLNVNEMWKSIVKMIVFNSLPLSFPEKKEFRILIKPIATALKDCHISFVPTAENIKIRIRNAKQNIRNLIANEVEKKMVCLMLDTASRYNRSVLGISICYWRNGRKQIRTLALRVLKVRQTARNLYELVISILAEYNIGLRQVFTVTTDNGRNLKKLVKIMDGELMGNSSCSYAGLFVPNVKNVSIEADEYATTGEAGENDIDAHIYANDEQNFDPETFDDGYFYDLLTSLRNKFDENVYTNLISGVCCAAHCLHLVVMDAIKSCTHFSEVIEKCRTLSKKLRTPNMRGLLESKKLKMALLDVKTRWSSMYRMVSAASSDVVLFVFVGLKKIYYLRFSVPTAGTFVGVARLLQWFNCH